MLHIGPYRVQEEIARGGMGVVYRAQAPDGRLVALKLLLAQRASEPRARLRFQREIQLLSRLRHPHVVPILGSGEHEGCPWLALEFVEGESLETRLRAGPLSVWEATRVVQQLAQALSYVHTCGLLHRDLKPDNVLLRGNDALLTDFGLALDDGDLSASRITATGVFLGTPGYWSPEQAQGDKAHINARSDVYGLGAVLYACLTARPPVQAESIQDFFRSVAFASTPRVRELRPEVPAWLDALCMRCLRTDPDDRPASMQEVARALVLADRGAPVPTQRRLPAALGLAAALAVVGAGGLGWALLRSTPQPESPPPSPPNAPPSADPPPRTNDPTPADRFADAAKAKLDRGDYAGSLAECERALELDPNHVRALNNRGICKAGLGQREEAIADYDRAIELDPGFALAWSNRGLSKLGLERFNEAITDFSQAIELDPEFADAFASRGFCCAALRRWREALDDFDRALALGLAPGKAEKIKPVRAQAQAVVARESQSLSPLNASEDPQTSALIDASNAKIQARDYEGAVADLTAALEREPNNLAALIKRGSMHARLGNPLAALNDLNRAADLSPQTGVIYLLRGGVHLDFGDGPKAVPDFERALKLGLPESAEGLAREQLDKARALVPQTPPPPSATPDEPTSAQAWFKRGAAALRSGREQEAIAAYDRGLELDPTHAEGFFLRGLAKRTVGQLNQAIEDFSRALQLDSGLVNARIARGEVRHDQRRYREAIADFELAQTQAPRLAAPAVGLGKGKQALQQYAEAIPHFDRAIEVNQREAQPYASYAYIGRGISLGALGRYAKAREDFDEAVRLSPNDAQVYSLRGKTSLELNDPERALSDFERALSLGAPPTLEPRIRRDRARALKLLGR